MTGSLASAGRAAIIQMDQVTQQNAALVKEAAAAADSMQEQSRQLAVVVGTFRLPEEAAAQRTRGVDDRGRGLANVKRR